MHAARLCHLSVNCIDRSGAMSSVWIEENWSSLFRVHRVASFQRHPSCKTVRHSMDRMTGELRHSVQREVMALDGLIARKLQKNQKWLDDRSSRLWK